MMKQICEKCGKAIDGYAATVHTVENWKSGHTNIWCEKCCEDHGMCKCDGCSEEFAEEFHMPRIDGGLFCIPCAQEKMPECFDECSVFKTGDDCQNKLRNFFKREPMRFLFTTSSDISDGVILTFDLKTRIIRISSQRRTDGYFEEFSIRVDDLFCSSCHHRLNEMAFSDLVFQGEAFDFLIGRLFELTEQDMFDMGGAEETAIEIVAMNYNETIRPNKSNRSLTENEFTVVLIGHLYRSLYRKIFLRFLDRDLGTSRSE